MPVYTFTGQHLLLDDGNGDWRIKFLSSGVLTWLSRDTMIDIFLVGGGGAGACHIYSAAGGAGGYTNTIKSHKLINGSRTNITIGAGGTSSYSGVTSGGATMFESFSASGGNGGKYSGANGGSGGGGSSDGNYPTKTSGKGGDGGSDGGNGTGGTGQENHPGGRGQGRTTREFGEPGGELYSGGGGGASYGIGSSLGGGKGGAGTPKLAKWGGSGVLNNAYADGGGAGGGYGGGGGGATGSTSSGGMVVGGSGAQGIAIIRNARA